jgi:hypothetical protein
MWIPIPALQKDDTMTTTDTDTVAALGRIEGHPIDAGDRARPVRGHPDKLCHRRDRPPSCPRPYRSLSGGAAHTRGSCR